MTDRSATLQLNDEDIAYLLTLLRTASSPVSTEQLVETLKQRPAR